MKWVALLWLVACGGAEVAPAPVAAPAFDRSAPVPADSIDQLEVAMVDHRGQPVGLDVYRGKPVLVSMFYANCPSACPMLIEEIRRLEGTLTPEQLAGMRVLLVSMDPERDTPELMARVAADHRVDSSRWTLARADEPQVREIAALLGIRYRKLEDGEMNHSSILTALDREGRIKARVDGLGRDPAPLSSVLTGRDG